MTTLTSPWSPRARRRSTLNEQAFDCVVLDLRLPDMTGFEVLERFRDTPTLGDLPVVVFTGKELSPRGRASAFAGTQRCGKGVESPERLLDESNT